MLKSRPEHIIGIGRYLTIPLLPQHRPYGSRSTAFQMTVVYLVAISGKPKFLKYLFGSALVSAGLPLKRQTP